MQLRHPRATVVGLPAILLAVGSRNACAAVLVLLLLPAAVLGEHLRNQLAWSE